MEWKKQLVVPILIGQFAVFNPCAILAQNAIATISLENSVITQHEPTIVDVTIENSSSTPVHFDPGYDDERIDVTVVDPAGQTWKRQHLARQEGIRFSHAVDVAPAASSVSWVLLNDWFPFSKVGDYQIEVTLSPSSAVGSKEIGEVSTKLRLTVLPRDELQLESTCADLVKKIKSLHSASAAIVAAKALARVDDPVAVPFLAEAMKRKEFAGLMITALARLKTDKAVDALASATRSTDPETRSLARSALTSLGEMDKR